jgi:hypothetical protein
MKSLLYDLYLPPPDDIHMNKRQFGRDRSFLNVVELFVRKKAFNKTRCQQESFRFNLDIFCFFKLKSV